MLSAVRMTPNKIGGEKSTRKKLSKFAKYPVVLALWKTGMLPGCETECLTPFLAKYFRRFISPCIPLFGKL